MSIDIGIVGLLPSFMTDAGWCNEFHHSTEK